MSGGHDAHGGHNDHHAAPTGSGWSGGGDIIKHPVGFALGATGATAAVIGGVGMLLRSIFRR